MDNFSTFTKSLHRRFSLLLMLLFFSLSANAQLNGTYSVNALGTASATNYLTVTSAVSDMMTGVRTDGGPVNGPGVSGPVTIRLAAGSGPYNEQVTVGLIPGINASRPVRITGGPTRQTIQFTGTTTTDRHVVKLNGARHVTLDSLTLLNNDAVYGYGVHITNGADSNFVTNNIVTVNNTATGTNFAGITISGATVTTNGDWGEDNTIQGNTVSGGYYGITARGVSTTVYSQRNKFIGNTVSEVYFYGIYSIYQNLTEYKNNIVSARAAASTGSYGIFVSNVDRFQVENNIVRQVGGFGLYFVNANYQGGSPTSRAKVVNNMVGGGFLGTTPYGIYATTNTTNVDFFHNSVSLNSGNGRCMYILSGSGNDIRNNSFAITNSTTGYAFYASLATYVSAVDYNNYYAPGSSNFIFIGVAYTPANFIGGGGYNTNSRTGDPGYVNPANDLHIANSVQLYDAGTSVGVATDIDGQARPQPPTSIVDLGADEFTPSLLDAGAVSVTNPVQPFAPGVSNVDVTIRNYGINTLTSASVNWMVNGAAQAPYAWSGSLATGVTSSSFNIGSFNFLAGNSYTLKIWTSAPNSGVDQSASNDTIYVNLCVAISGTYTVGSGGDYPNFTAALNQLLCAGVAGPTVFRALPGAGPFNEQLTIPPIAGSSAVNTIEFSGGVNMATVTTGSTTNNDRHVIKLNGADYFILDSLTIVNTGATYGYGVQLTNSADYNKITNCMVRVDSTQTVTNFAGITLSSTTVSTDGDNGDYNLIEGNDVSGGYYSITMRGPSATTFNYGNKIRNNNLRNIYYYGIYSYNQDQPELISNYITYRATSTTAAYGIYSYNNDLFKIEKNNIQNPGTYGIFVYAGNYQFGAPVARASLNNNMVGGSFRAATPYGIYLSTNCTNIDVFHNTVNLDNGNGRAFNLLATTGGNDVRNNCFVVRNSTTGYALYVTNTSAVNTVNYNNYWAPGSSNYIFIGAAYSQATYLGGGGYNLNSRDGDPLFADPSTDLHVVGAQLNDAGDNSVAVLTDIDGDARPYPLATIVDIGADEYRPLDYDATPVSVISPTNYICPDSLTPVTVVVLNQGQLPLSNIPVNVTVSGFISATLSDTIAGPLASNAMDTITVGYLNTWNGGALNFVTSTNLSNDQDLTDDTLETVIMIAVVPSPPVANGFTVCTGDSGVLSVDSTGFTHYWFDSNIGGVLVATGDTLPTPALTSTTTWYVEAAGFAPNSITTTFAGGNGCGAGNMFDVTPINSIVIDSMDLNINSSAVVTVEVYYRVGGYAGFETNAGAWTLNGTYSVTGQGSGNPTRVVINPMNLPSGSVYGIYVNFNATYTTLGTTYSNSDLTISTGVGLCSAFGGTNTPRTFNGTLHYTSEGCHSLRTPVTATVNTFPVVNLGADTSTCAGNSITLDAGNPGMSYSWSNTDVTQTTVVSTSGTYAVVVDNQGCTGTDTILVSVNPLPVVSLGNDTTICDGTNLLLDAGNAGSAYLWCDGSTTQTTSVNTAGSYCVEVTDGNGCSANDTVLVNTITRPSASFSADTTNCPTVSFTDLSSGTPASNWAWTFGDGGVSNVQNPTYTYTGNGNYTVTLISTNSCGSDTSVVTVEISCILASGDPLASGVSVYPNPSDGNFTVEMLGWAGKEVSLKLSDLRGVTVMEKTVDVTTDAHRETISAGELSKGTYFLRMVSAESIQVVKVVIR